MLLLAVLRYNFFLLIPLFFSENKVTSMAANYDKPDFWSRKAFKEGYPARSVYKLKEMNEKFKLIPNGGCVLDLGAAPGSWTSYLLRTLSKSSRIVACDLNELSKDVKAENLSFVRGDLNEADVREQIRGLGPYDTIVCDAAPLTTGNRIVDTARSSQLVEMAIWYAEKMLASGGNFCVKMFQNGDQQASLKKMREVFATAKGFKPEACRSESFEMYLIGLGKK